MLKDSLYHYRAKVVSIYDGDTLTMEVDLGFRVSIRETFRMSGIDAPELRGDERTEGLRSRDWLRQNLPEGTEVLVETIKDRRGRDSKGKYGRYLATLYIEGDDAGRDDYNINEGMIRLGLAEKYEP